MKTWKYTGKLTARLGAYLIAVSYPFQYDGFSIEFTATDRIIDGLLAADKKFSKEMFESC